MIYPRLPLDLARDVRAKRRRNTQPTIAHAGEFVRDLRGRGRVAGGLADGRAGGRAGLIYVFLSSVFFSGWLGGWLLGMCFCGFVI